MRYTLDKSNYIEHEGETLYLVLDKGEATKAFAVDGVGFADVCDVRGGHFYAGVFRGGVFDRGVFYGGFFRGGRFYDGYFHDGLFFAGKYLAGWLPLQIQGSKHFVNVPDGKNIQIGCECGSVDWWRENYERLGKDNYYTPEQVKEYKRYIDLAAEMIMDVEQL